MDIIDKLNRKTIADQTSGAQGKYVFLSERIIGLLNFRINQEELSSRIYLAFSIALQDKAYFNAAKLYKKYSDEELSHANKCREYLLSFNILPKTQPIESVENELKGLKEIIYKTLEHEALVTEQCKELAKACMEEGDHLTYSLAQWFLSEQVEEMEKSWDLVNHIETFGDDKIALKLLDNYISELL